MLELHWGARKARLWLDELPEWAYPISEEIESQQPASEGIPASLHRTAIELFFLIGARDYYGGIAVTFTPTQYGRLVVRVPISEDSGDPYKETLANSSWEETFKGLPREYIPGVLEGLMKGERTVLLGSGILQVESTVHGHVGSSIFMFHILGRMVVKLLTSDPLSLSEQELIELINSEITWKGFR